MFCNTCKLDHPDTPEFWHFSNKRAYCKEAKRQYYLARRDEIRLKRKARIAANPEKHRAAQKRSYQKHRAQRIEKVSAYYRENKDRIREARRPGRREYERKYRARYCREREARDPLYRLKRRLRTNLWRARQFGAVSSSLMGLGCSYRELLAHLEAQFQPGMSWDNYGEWHIDHILPLANYDLTDRGTLRRLSNYTNLQPLWAKDNLSKGDKEDGVLA